MADDLEAKITLSQRCATAQCAAPAPRHHLPPTLPVPQGHCPFEHQTHMMVLVGILQTGPIKAMCQLLGHTITHKLGMYEILCVIPLYFLKRDHD